MEDPTLSMVTKRDHLRVRTDQENVEYTTDYCGLWPEADDGGAG